MGNFLSEILFEGTMILDFTFWLPFGVSIVAVIISFLTYLVMRRGLQQESEVSRSLIELVSTLREQLDLVRRGQLSTAEIKRQRLLQRREELQWRKFRDLAKGIGWLLEQASDEERFEE